MSSQKDFLAELECPVCNEYMRPPIKMCEIGHSLCHICQSKTKNCPQCKSKFTNARNFALERMSGKVEVRCKNSVHGCKYKNKAEKIEDHEINKCWFIRRTCPMSLSGNCTFKASINNIIGHLQQQHHIDDLEISDENTNEYFINYFCNHFSDDAKRCKNILAGKDNDFFLIRIVKLSDFFKWHVYFIGLPHVATKFDYKIKIKYMSSQSRRGYTIGGICESAFNGNVEYDGGHSAQFSIQSLYECLNRKGTLFFTFKVIEH